MKIRKSLLLLSATGLLASLGMAAQAQDEINEEMPEAPAFEEIDRNADGVITIGEAEETWLEGVFVQIDADQNGSVTKVEYDKAKS